MNRRSESSKHRYPIRIVFALTAVLVHAVREIFYHYVETLDLVLFKKLYFCTVGLLKRLKSITANIARFAVTDRIYCVIMENGDLVAIHYGQT